VNYLEVKELLHDAEKLTRCRCVDKIARIESVIQARYFVNACGPWVDHIRRMNGSMGSKRLHLTKGVHIVVPHEKLPVKQSIYFDVPDGRMIFTIPRGRTTYIGTTDTDYKGDLDAVLTTREDARYLIDAVNHAFPQSQLTPGDIESSWAGIRPLIHQEGKSASEISRKDEIFEAPDGMISIAGGKLTGYRRMAQKTVDIVVKRYQADFGYEFGPCITRHIPLVEDPLWNDAEVDHYRKVIRDWILGIGLDGSYAGYLVSNYGKQTHAILSVMKDFEGSEPEEALIRSELKFCVEKEMVMGLLDFFDRRTGRLSFHIASVDRYKEVILNDLIKYIGLTADQGNTERSALETRLKEVRLI
jgi:glycerol-3-phosphate dehydrogenase